MSTCEAAADSVPDDERVADDCVSGFIFPDDEDLIQAEFAKNIPFAMSVARSAHDPDDPVSAADSTHRISCRIRSVSYGRDQTMAVTAKRSLKDARLHYSINGGRTESARVREWRGGERYGDTANEYYGEFRAQGWKEWFSDLTAYAVQQVAVSISSAGDWGSQGTGVFLDEVTVFADESPVADTGSTPTSEAGRSPVRPRARLPVPTIGADPSSASRRVRSRPRRTRSTRASGTRLAADQRDDLVARSMRHLLPSS